MKQSGFFMNDLYIEADRLNEIRKKTMEDSADSRGNVTDSYKGNIRNFDFDEANENTTNVNFIENLAKSTGNLQDQAS